MEFKIGADPEVFLFNKQKNSVASVIGTIGGTKDIPTPLPMLGDGFAVQEDNVALEFNIPPAGNKAEFVKSIATATGFLEQTMIDLFGLHFVNISAVSFPLEELQHPNALMFGCDPDYNAWTGEVNPKPLSADPNLRSCGGHVHVGVDGVDVWAGGRACDLFLAVPSVLMDTGELRKQLYGKAGAMRKKSYGFEYRTLSNFWIFNPRLVEWVYDNTNRALESVAAGVELDSDKPLILEAINNNNKEVALQLVNKYNLEVVHA